MLIISFNFHFTKRASINICSGERIERDVLKLSGKISFTADNE